VGDILSIRGGIHKRPAKVQVMQVSNEKYAYHGILKVRVIDGGDYTALPANSYPQQMASAEGGAGTGARFFVYDGAYEPVLSAFGSTNAWMQLGAEWYSQTNNVGGKSMASYLQDWYPNPPFLQFLSNNEAPLENITDPGINLDINTDKRYLNLYGSGQTDDFKREKLGEGWISHYRTMMNAMKDALTPAWRGKARFIGYEAFGPGCFGRWGGWKAYSFYIPNRISPHPLMWDGGTPSYYLWNIPGYQTWQQDYLLNSPQMEAMNYPFMLDEAYGLNLDFWFDLSTWNGASSGANSNVGYLASLGQTYTPERYAGMVQFGMWLTRPRAITDFNSADPGGADALPYIMSLVNAVDRVHTDPVLKSFWRQSDLVPNTARPHPYQSNIPPEYANTNRMFMLSTNLDPAQPWTGGATEFPVFYLARLKDNGSGNRVWLVYGFSPK